MKRSYRSGGTEPPSLEDTKHAIEKRLFVGRLPANGVNEDEIREAFERFGTITECRLVNGKGIAFVAYNTWAAAHRALAAMDGQSLMGSQAIAVSFAERTGAGRGIGKAFEKGLDFSRVFVGSLPEGVTDDDLRQIFEPYGTVEAANLLLAKSNKRCGFVNFQLWGEALDAIENLHETHPHGRYSSEAMTVVLAASRERGSRNGDSDRRESDRGSDRDGYSLSSKSSRSDYGPPAKRHRSDGYGDDFESLKAAYISAIEGNTPDEICTELHRKILAARSSGSYSWGGDSYHSSHYSGSGSAEDRDSARLFVGGLPYECTDEELKALVEQVPFSRLSSAQTQIHECRVLPNKGVGYLRFGSWEAAQEAINSLNDRAVSGWELPLRVRWASAKGRESRSGDGERKGDKVIGVVGEALKAVLGSDPAAAVAKLASGRENDKAAGMAAETEESITAQGLDSRRLFVGQLTRDLRHKADLEHVFDAFGRVENLRWLQDKCVAYIQYDSFESARAAIVALDTKAIPGVSREQGFNISFSKLR